jgi:RNA polymerase sigma-70 factor (ECF subfamily)
MRRFDRGREARVSTSVARIAGSDEAVLAESLSCPERFGELYSRYFAEVYRYMAGRLGPDAADDLAAETFLAAFRRRSIARWTMAPLAPLHLALRGIASHSMNRERLKGLGFSCDGAGDPV